ncbi:eukaryotic translation initiation factor 3 subunit A isoform X1 [Parasteatoda tepidariorum]|uniref:eukaryotic translation initiation factor 3 subunit A isoform X1 n=2 Tax=Parasteatoda tepidariorum TaxID=114398 RepID=UPI001C71A61E|nr:caldesmon isoform X1 [Parasteatoda tepidariorum]XP_042897899.1 caldesmon isoform X1 [Parasteatoda tepidariorum]XP_042897904.1 caldesmon isoform X1 [Parasteatoda tepidariorum]
MNSLQSQIHDFIEEVEKITHFYRQNLKEEKRNIENTSKRVSELVNSISLKEEYEAVKSIEPMRVSLPNHSVLDSLFKEESNNNGFLLGEDREEKSKKLAAERRAEYNAYLEKKERELQKKHQTYEEMSTTVTPRSVMESVDYETILAKRREEELKFRQIHHAEPSLSNGVANSEKITVPKIPQTPEKIPLRENNVKITSAPIVEDNKKVSALTHDNTGSYERRYIPHRPLSSQENHFHRTGGGGEPVRDSFGNLITARGFRDSAPMLSFPSFQQNQASSNKSSYREELAKQIEERKRLAELEKLKAEELENKIAQRIAEERRKMQMEYENELKANNNVKEQRQQERLRQLEEFQRRDAETKQKLKNSRAVESRPQTSENINRSVENRKSSPPIPAVRSKIIFERVTSPEVLREVPPVKPENVFSSLAEIRKKIMQDRQNSNRAIKGTYEVMNRRTVHDDEEDEYDRR